MKRITFLVTVVIIQLEAYQALAQSDGGKVLDKKTAYIGLLLSYTNTTKENTKSTFENIKYAKASESSIKTGGGYFFKKNFAVGLAFSYGAEKENMESINAVGPNTITDQDLQTFAFTPFIRNYFPLSKKNRFYLFTQTGLQFGFGNGEESTSTGNTTVITDIQKNNYGIAFTPGMIFIVEKGFAFEVNVGILGLNYSKETKTTPDQPQAVLKETNFDLNINLLRLNLGISYYF
ncbi:outer membrane beta-barrel protein [Flavihumibacter fluvii]|uniref:outer membrane beta-barrel protein n=1 Tax=Flavihumibacter fluvii TaxID=2838157 RepID=UPI001BDE9DC4|nr:outer membrane beta-barrel protein [Flavihumibacter fluvii]ULQ53197.1 outer membrane beta-barrel protein [Flavihumibacter fluvii]